MNLKFTALLVFIIISAHPSLFGQKVINLRKLDTYKKDYATWHEYKPIIKIDSLPLTYTLNLDTINENWEEYARVIINMVYLGKDTVKIESQWTGDPHYICEFPRKIIPGKPFRLVFCCVFYRSWDYYRPISKMMGLSCRKDQYCFRFLLIAKVRPEMSEPKK